MNKMKSAELLDTADKHLIDLKATKNKRRNSVLLLSLCSILFGITLSYLYLRNGDTFRAVLVLLPFALIFPFALVRLSNPFAGKNFSLAQDIVQSYRPTPVTVESLNCSTRFVRLKLPDNKERDFVIDDLSFGIFHTLESKLTLCNSTETDDTNNSLAGQAGSLYAEPEGVSAILFVNKTALRLECVFRAKMAMVSGGKWPRIPVQNGQGFRTKMANF